MGIQHLGVGLQLLGVGTQPSPLRVELLSNRGRDKLILCEILSILQDGEHEGDLQVQHESCNPGFYQV